MSRKPQARTYELAPGDVVQGHGRVTGVESGGWAGWRRVRFEDGHASESVTVNHVWTLEDRP
jgi:hypothetical protein